MIGEKKPMYSTGPVQFQCGQAGQPDLLAYIAWVWVRVNSTA